MMRQRQVVSSFICTPVTSSEGLKVLLFKRSEKVGSYQFVLRNPRLRHLVRVLTAKRGKWAACSGSIDPNDPSPEAAAWREIREETGLTESDISLLRRGKAFKVVDKALNTEWTVHPFAFILKP